MKFLKSRIPKVAKSIFINSYNIVEIALDSGNILYIFRLFKFIDFSFN
jgi:hypothetical protein